VLNVRCIEGLREYDKFINEIYELTLPCCLLKKINENLCLIFHKSDYRYWYLPKIQEFIFSRKLLVLQLKKFLKYTGMVYGK
jgi:hypothetical protein